MNKIYHDNRYMLRAPFIFGKYFILDS